MKLKQCACILPLLLSVVFLSNSVFAQNWNIPTNGSAVSGTYLGTYNSGSDDLIIKNRGVDRMRFYSGGQISIGQPQSTVPSNVDFEIYHTWTPRLSTTTMINSVRSSLIIGLATSNGDISGLSTPGDAIIAARDQLSDLIIASGNNSGSLRFSTGTTDTERLTILSNGNIGIGTVDPQQKLVVNGTICAKEMRVSLSGSPCWPDYVFAKGYKLKPLSVLESEIITLGHLPGIPSAQEVEKQGVLLGDMQIKSLEKIEELTLYLINQQKEIDLLKEQIELLKKANEVLLEKASN